MSYTPTFGDEIRRRLSQREGRYSHNGISEDYTSSPFHSVEILDPEGVGICSVIIHGTDLSPVDALLSHLNRS